MNLVVSGERPAVRVNPQRGVVPLFLAADGEMVIDGAQQLRHTGPWPYERQCPIAFRDPPWPGFGQIGKTEFAVIVCEVGWEASFRPNDEIGFRDCIRG